MKKVAFEVTYQPNEMAVKMSDFMAACDLGIGSVVIIDIWEWKTTTKTTKKYYETMEKKIRQAVEENGGRVFGIKLLDN